MDNKEKTKETVMRLNEIARTVRRAATAAQSQFDDLTDQTVYNTHAKLLVYIANNVVLAPQNRKFVIDDNNKDILRFMLYYFNNCNLAEEVFPDKGYKLHKNLLIMGGVGVGKTMLMQIFR